MSHRQKWMGFFICFSLLMYLQAFLVQPIYANVEEVQTDGQNIHKTELSDGKGESVGGGGEDVPWWQKAWNWLEDIGSDGLELLDEFGATIGEQLNEFLDWAGEASDGAMDWFSEVGSDIGDWFLEVGSNIGEWFKEVGSAIGGFFSDALEWVKENKWFQTIVAGALATVAIVVGVFVFVGSWPALAVIAVIGGLALGAGFLYQWLAGDNYNFFGAFFVSLIGGAAGYFGMTTGAFAAAWTWLRHTAAPAAWSWIRNTAVPWIVARGQSVWGWMRNVAFPWLSRKAVAGWRWFKGLPVWGQIRTAYMASGALRTFFTGMGISGVASAIINIASQMLGDEPFSIKSFFIDTTLGALTGGLFAPVLVPGAALGGSLIATISIIGGFENWLGGVIEEGDWFNWQSFVSGSLTSLISLGILSKVFGKIPNPFGEEIGTKATEEPIKNWIEDILTGEENNKKTAPEKKPSEPLQSPSENPSDNSTDTETNEPVEDIQDVEDVKDPILQPQTNVNQGRLGAGVHPQPLQ